MSQPDLLFLTGFAFLAIGHELDAIQQKEWRFFFALVPISDENAYRIFTALHIPLFIWLAVSWHSPVFQFWFNIFLIAHAAVHWLLRKHPLIMFDSWFSRFWIYGGAVLGVAHLFLNQW